MLLTSNSGDCHIVLQYRNAAERQQRQGPRRHARGQAAVRRARVMFEGSSFVVSVSDEVVEVSAGSALDTLGPGDSGTQIVIAHCLPKSAPGQISYSTEGCMDSASGKESRASRRSLFGSITMKTY